MNQNAAFQIVMLIRELYGKVSCQLNENMTAHQLTHQQLIVIKLIAHHKKLTVNDLCKEMSLTKGTVSGIISRLEKQGILQKEHDVKDKRSVWISFSPEGLKIARELRETMNHSFEALFDDIDLSKRTEIIDTLKYLLAIMPQKEN
ncbi:MULTISPECIES: MarR family winged helix-turn-helix transcriptional regulator [unclassified Fusibacter]|uniref:MarR family winged helix-turn-helix transcriptional regulator n=1 Tax=unclassified Fusibacter TaxID=2624464 RepID=UPI001011D2DF|nr:MULTISPECIES: MarR family transcriptional regulator [unclassified Fusibacter]MCK8061196.1 MarR family transcriptional regulator [Fusibacter sp. A2]NPE23267.1 MarR family transcriptional regulator [Fusibacter sp. A1]RXV59311.1 MarR family transcriptional regulator [Fusibacter sp. A1]